LRRRASRKRQRSDETTTARNDVDDNGDGSEMSTHRAVGRLKCDEDYQTEGEGATASLHKSPVSCPKGENWLCLKCGAMLCSRYANGHARMHWEDTKEEDQIDNSTTAAATTHTITTTEKDQAAVGHCIAVSLTDLSVWCYECNAYLTHPKLSEMTKRLEKIKFGEEGKIGGAVEDVKAKVPEEDMIATGGDGDANSCDASIHINNNEDEDMNSLPNSNRYQNSADRNDGCVKVDEEGNSLNDNSNGSNNSEDEVEDEDDYQNDSDNESKASLLSGQVGTTIRAFSHDGQDSDANLHDDDESSESESESDSSGPEGTYGSDHQAVILSSLLQSEHANAIRAFMARHESFDPGDMSQCVPLMMPKPPTFPDEMADFLRSPLCKSIIVLAGAGMSVSSGIPDFRSAGVGLYDTLRPELLTATDLERELIRDEPTLALDKGMFLRNPLPMLELKRDFILGTHQSRWKATLAHRFVELLHSKLGKLTRLYTQNIDGLELQCRDLPEEKIVNVHGSMGRAACEVCEAEANFDDFCSKVRSSIKDITGMDADAPRESTPIVCEACGAPAVKPTIVLFRGSMPKEFHARTAEDLPQCDLLIIMGTSLTVAPANSLVYRIPPTCLRMVMNNEKVGRRLGIDYSENSIRDCFAHGHSDVVCLDLAEKMGWLDDLEAVIDELPESSAQLLRERLNEREDDDAM